MDIFCRNIPQAVTDKHLAKEMRPVLEKYGLFTFKCRKNGQRTAIITVIDKDKASKLLSMHGQQPGQKRRPPQQIKLFGQPIYFEPGRSAPEDLLVRCLEQNEEDRQTSLVSKSVYGAEPPLTKDNRSLLVLGMTCGVWAYERGVPIFVECYSWGREGVLVFRQRSIKVELKERYSNDVFTIDFAYSNLYSIFTGRGRPSLTITTKVPPRLYHSSEEDQRKAREAQMTKRNIPSRNRVGFFPGDQEACAGCCYSYRFVLQDGRDLSLAKSLGRKFHCPEMYEWRDSVGQFPHSFQSHIRSFIERLRVDGAPFCVKFQLQALIWNGNMSPLQAVGFLSHIRTLLAKNDEDTISRALMKLRNELAFPSPDIQAWQVELKNVVSMITSIIKDLNREKNSGIAPQRIHPNMINIHHVSVTPCGMFLSGPRMEAKNRVLRKYENHTDHFLRVTFTDEDGGPVRYDFKANTDKIFHDRFKNIMKQGIDIGGRHFKYLGFSHSSLRSQTCWFVAPFTTPHDGKRWDARSIIEDLGIFTNIPSPSKIAARIGQTFSDTVASIEIPPGSVRRLIDVERNGRCFSDGVGTISLSLAQRIWKQYGSKAPKRPTVFQIRYAGAKGMVSLNSRLRGDQLLLRDSMIKFEATGSAIEICGSGIRALPFYLNQQLIKILEDLGVPPTAFMRLQGKEVQRLRSTPDSASTAADFLEGTHIPRSIGFPWLIRTLENELGLSFKDDQFLRSLVNLAILIRLRDLKYRARIPVPSAVTLYGVMDETGFLGANEIYCAMTNEDGQTQVLVRDNVVITRSPALHPGDIQLINAVNVADPDHPLKKLHNCVVFSQHGFRDLPSMLSGGDLDGDLYNIIYDETLLPGTIYDAAEYPPVMERKLDRPVLTDDIIDFFVTFMQQDQLGRIATVHQILADQLPNGTLDKQCRSMAELHSVAVDFSKSGTPADMSRIPRIQPYRPDFMATGPRVKIADDISLFQDQDGALAVDFDDPDDDEPRPMQYYKSKKVLGQLYRAIDETTFFKEIKNAFEPSSENANVLAKIWKYVQSRIAGFQWEHLIEKAEGIKELYEGQVHMLMANYSETAWKGTSVTEYEVILGTILGQGQKQSRLNKEQSKSLRDEYEEVVDLVVSTIRDSQEENSEGLEFSVACFHVAIRDHENYMRFARRVNSRNRENTKVISFVWLAATVCLKELIRFQMENLPVFIH